MITTDLQTQRSNIRLLENSADAQNLMQVISYIHVLCHVCYRSRV